MFRLLTQRNHDLMVRELVDLLYDRGYTDIRADLEGFARPNRIYWEETGQGYIPDVTAKGDKFNIFEVETSDSINDQHTADQWQLFAAYAQQHSSIFWVVVPRGYAQAARARLISLGISAEVLEI